MADPNEGIPVEEQKPTNGGIVRTLRVLAVLQFLAVMMSFTAFELDNITVFHTVFDTVILAVLLWAAAAVVQGLRGIEFNTRK